MIPSGPALAVILAAILTFYVGEETIKGAKWIAHQAKKGGAAVVHVLAKVPH